MKKDIVDALVSIGGKFEIKDTYSTLIWKDDIIPKPTEEEIQAKIVELEVAEPMRLLREERNRRLMETDWWAAGDRIDSMTNEQKNYRNQLRDLPSTASPKLDDNGQLTNITWPKKPE